MMCHSKDQFIIRSVPRLNLLYSPIESSVPHLAAFLVYHMVLIVTDVAFDSRGAVAGEYRVCATQFYWRL